MKCTPRDEELFRLICRLEPGCGELFSKISLCNTSNSLTSSHLIVGNRLAVFIQFYV